MYAERNSRLLLGPASDRIHRLSRTRRTEYDLTSKKDDQSLRGQIPKNRLPTGLPFRCYDVLDASRTRRASPLLAGLSTGITPGSGNSITRQGISLFVLPNRLGGRHLPWNVVPACRHAEGTISSSCVQDIWRMVSEDSDELVPGLSPVHRLRGSGRSQ
jgi:hypothetical protein